MKKSLSTTAPGSFAWARAILAKGGRLSPKEIALLLERNPSEPLPVDLRETAIKALRKNGLRGRKRVVGTARWDFTIADAKELYEQSLPNTGLRMPPRDVRQSPGGKCCPALACPPRTALSIT